MTKMLIDEALVRQALDDLEKLAVTVDWEWGSCRSLAEIEADGDLSPVVIDLRQALADAALDKKAENARELGLSYEQPAPAQEPVACKDCGAAIKNGKVKCVRGRNCWVGRQPAPAQHWVGLTDEEIVSLMPITGHRPVTTFARAIEAKLKENNTKGGA